MGVQMNYTQLEAGLAALANASRQRNIFLVAARNAIVNDIRSATFVVYAETGVQVTATPRASTATLITALGALSLPDIRQAEADIADIVAGRTPNGLAANLVANLTAYAINTTNLYIRTDNPELQAAGVTAAIETERTRRVTALTLAQQEAQLIAVSQQLQTAMAGITAAYQQAEARALAATQALAGTQVTISQLVNSNTQLQTSLTNISAAYNQAEARAGEATQRLTKAQTKK